MPNQGFLGEVDIQWLRVLPCGRANKLNEHQSGHMVRVVVGEQDLVETLYRDAQIGTAAGHRIPGTGVDQQPSTVVTVLDHGGMGTVARGAGTRTKKADFHLGHLIGSGLIKGGLDID